MDPFFGRPDDESIESQRVAIRIFCAINCCGWLKFIHCMNLITRFRGQFFCKLWPIQLASLLFMVWTIFLSTLTLCKTSSFLTRSVQPIDPSPATQFRTFRVIVIYFPKCPSASTAASYAPNVAFNYICYIIAKSVSTAVELVLIWILTLRLLMSYVYGAPILDVSRSHTTTQHSR